MATARFKGNPEDWLRWLGSNDPDLSQQARLALGGLTPQDGFSPEVFLAALASDDDDIVLWSVVALGRLEAGALRAIPGLVRLASAHRAFGVRQAAVSALPRIGSEEPEVKPALLAALTDASPFVRREALQALTALPQLEQMDLRTIENMGADPDQDVARWSKIALRNIGSNRGDA